MNQRILVLSFISVFLVACGTNKQGQLKPLSKIYQNTTARYNGYFNGQQLYNKSVKTLEESYQDNYNKLLPMYKFVAIEQTSSVANDLDVTMEKATTVVNLHPRSKWVDDCYFLVGQSQFAKKEYEAAQHTFEHVIEEFHPDNLEIATMRMAAKYEKKARERDEQTAKDYKRSNRRVKNNTSKPKSKKKTRSEKKTSDDVKDENQKEDKKKSREERLKERKKKKKESQKKSKKKTRSKDSGQLAGANKRNKGTKERKERKKKDDFDDDEIVISHKNEKEGYFLKHKPVHSDAMLWLAKTYIANKKYDDALFKLSQLEDDATTRDEVLDKIHEIRAFAYLEKGDYQDAIGHINLALEHANKPQQARLNFILGQLYQVTDDKLKAAEAYARVVSLHPNYEMQFHAKLNQIRSQWDIDGNSAEKTAKLLERMLKDEKNEEFKDQIYFTLGESYLAQNDIQSAHENFRKAVKYGSGNKHILTESYYILAEYDFDHREYESAKYLFDTTLVNMQKTDERYAETLEKSKKLTAVTTQLDIIELQDSLVRLSLLTVDEKRLFAYQVKSEKAEKLLESRNNKSQGSVNDTRVALTTGIVSKSREKSNFFAYNDKSLSKGKDDFRKRWGNRVLEDNWRRSQKSIEENLTNDDLEAIDAEELTQDEIDKIFKDVPVTPEEVKEAQTKSEIAMLTLAKLYSHELNDNPLSIQTLLHYLKMYEGSDREEEALYTLYLVYRESNQDGLADIVRQRLENEYGGGTYVQIINNPTFASEKDAEVELVLVEYDQAYDLYESGEASEALAALKSINERESIPTLAAPKFALLSALCIGSIDGKEAYLAALEGVVSAYPNTAEETRAKEMLRYLRGDKDVFNSSVNDSDSPFVTQKNRLHYVLVIFDKVNNDEKINKLRSQVSDYNREYHKLKKLRVGNVFLSRDDTKPILIIRKFTNAQLALDYYHSVNQNKDNFLSDHESHLVIINQKNYREVLRAKNLEDYENFFKENYL